MCLHEPSPTAKTKPAARSRRGGGRVLSGVLIAFAALPAAPALFAAASELHAAEPAPAMKPNPTAGQKIAAEVCAACHGPDGNGTAPVNPKLAGQGVDYLVKQLKDFKIAAGAKKAARVNPIMAGFAAGLTEQQMLDVSAYYANQPLKPSTAKHKDLVDTGRNLYRGGDSERGVPACAACHGPTGAGVPSQYPHVSGQYADYTEAQLVAFRSGARANNAPMATIAARLSDREFKALADYIAGLR